MQPSRIRTQLPTQAGTTTGPWSCRDTGQGRQHHAVSGGSGSAEGKVNVGKHAPRSADGSLSTEGCGGKCE